MRRRVYVWEIPVRLTHWVNVVSIVMLSFTGYYIANPYIFVSTREPWGIYFMGTLRFLHFAFAYIFVASLLLRTYWAFVGNQWASWRGLFPFLTAEGRKTCGMPSSTTSSCAAIRRRLPGTMLWQARRI